MEGATNSPAAPPPFPLVLPPVPQENNDYPTRACKAAGHPCLLAAHDLRHRRAPLRHLGGVPVAEAPRWLGHSAQEHLRAYQDVVMDRTEIDYTRRSGERIGASRLNPQTAA